MACVTTAAATRQQPPCCSGRGPWVAARRPPLPPPLGCRQQGLAPAARPIRAAALADERQSDEDDSWGQFEDDDTWQQPVKRMDFVYMSAAEVAAAEAAAEAAWAEGMREYDALQEWLLFRTWRFGLLFSGYLLFAANGEAAFHAAAFCELVGSAVGYGYFKWLIADVSRLQPGDRIPLVEAEKVEPKLARGAAKLFAAYRHALQPRLLVLPGLLASAAAFNATLAGPEGQLGLVEQGCLLGGFLSWKVALVLKIYEDLKPRPLTQDEILRQQRPSLYEVEDIKLDLREVAKRATEQQAAAAEAAAEAARQPPAQQ